MTFTRYFSCWCSNGHMLYWEEDEGPQGEEDAFCRRCGQPYLESCPSCSALILTFWTQWKWSSIGTSPATPRRPGFCGSCGEPFPWTAAEHKRIEEAGFWSLLHPDVARLARNRFRAGHYGDAVEAVFKELNSHVKTIYKTATGCELDGADLMREGAAIRRSSDLLGRPRHGVWAEHAEGLRAHFGRLHASDPEPPRPRESGRRLGLRLSPPDARQPVVSHHRT